MKNTIMDITRQKKFSSGLQILCNTCWTMNYKLGKLFFNLSMSGESYLVNDKTQMSYRVFLRRKLSIFYRLWITYLKNNIIGRFHFGRCVYLNYNIIYNLLQKRCSIYHYVVLWFETPSVLIWDVVTSEMNIKTKN